MHLNNRVRPRRDDGFTLIELLVCIVILGIIAVPLSMVLFGYFKNSNVTEARIEESHDIQMATTYFARDVASVGLRDAQLNPLPSTWTDAPISESGVACAGAPSTPAALVLAWTEYSSAGVADNVAVGYVAVDNNLYRVTCRGGAATPIELVNHLTANPTASCSPQDQCGLTFTVKADPASPGDTVTLTGDGRQT